MNLEHLDAEVLAGWAEGSLDRRARAAAEAHAADCPRCQALLAAMIRTEPVEVPQRAGWRPPLRWMVPLATAAAALTVWLMVSRVPDRAALGQPASRPDSPVAADRMRPMPAPPAEEPSTGAGRRERLADTQSKAPVPAASREIAPDEPERKSRAETRVAAAPAATATAPSPPARAETVVAGERPARVDELLRDAAAGGRPPLPPPAVPLPPRQVQAAQQQTQVGQSTQAQTQPVQGTQAAAQAPQQSAQAAPQVQERVAVTTAAPDVAVERRRAIAGKARAAVAVREVVSPDPSVRWRFGAAGLIERSRDGGKTWLPATSGVSVDLTAASAPSPGVCWIVGDSGTILLTTDGLTWRRVPFPVSTGLHAVAATDGKTATVATADGRLFTTTDGGATWR